MLLVDDHEAEPRNRREDGRACADDDRCAPRRDPLALVAPLGVRQRGVEDRDAIAEARAEATDRLRREGDLRHQHDDPEPALERARRGLEIHLRLPAPRRPVEQHVAAATVERADDLRDRHALRLGELGRLRLAAEPVTPRPARAARRAEPARGVRPAPVPARAWIRSTRPATARARRATPDTRSTTSPASAISTPSGGSTPTSDDDPTNAPTAQPDREDVPARYLVGHAVREGPRQRAGRDERIDLGERHGAASVSARSARPVPRPGRNAKSGVRYPLHGLLDDPARRSDQALR